MSDGARVSSAENRPCHPGWRVASVCHVAVLAGFAAVFTGLSSGIFNVLYVVTLASAFTMLALPAYRTVSRKEQLDASSAVILDPALTPEKGAALESN